MLDKIREKEIMGAWLEDVQEIIPVGPDVDRGRISVMGGEEVDCVEIVIGADGELWGAEGERAAVFESPELAWNLWKVFFENYVNRAKRNCPRQLQMSWRIRPEIGGCDCGRSNRVYARIVLYEKKGREWRYEDGMLIMKPA